MDFKVRSCEISVECNWVFNTVTSMSAVQTISVVFFMLVGLTWRNSQCWGHTQPWGSVEVIVLLP
jgi:hypothetical protein